MKTTQSRPTYQKPQAAAPPPSSTEIQTRIDGGMAFHDQLEQARVLIKSGFLPAHVKTAEQALVIMQTGKELGLPPMKAFRSIYVVHGNAGLSSQLMRALAEKSKELEEFEVRQNTDTACHIWVKRKGRKGRLFTFTREEADKAKFSMTWKKNENGTGGQWEVKDAWQKQPATMLEWRCTSKALRREFADVVLGLYTPEEIAHDVEIVEAQAVGAEGGEKVTDIEVKPVVEQTRMVQEAPAEDVHDVKVKVEDMDDEAIMRYALPGGKFKGMSLTSVYYQETGNGKPKGKIYLQELKDDEKTSKNVREILERFFVLISKEEKK